MVIKKLFDCMRTLPAYPAIISFWQTTFNHPKKVVYIGSHTFCTSSILQVNSYYVDYTQLFFFFSELIFLDLRLVDGSSRCHGRVEFRPSSSATFGQACDLDAGNSEAQVICRELGCNPTGARRVNPTKYVPSLDRQLRKCDL